MSSPKCRCGSDEKLVIKGGEILRVKDDKPHICLDDIDRVPEFKNTISEQKKVIEGLVAHNKYLESLNAPALGG